MDRANRTENTFFFKKSFDRAAKRFRKIMENPSSMPKKPTHPFGTINFSKDGKVRPDIRRLSEDRVEQEKGAIDIIAEQFGRMGRPITDIIQLPESDHDFGATCEGNPIIIQLTKLVSRDFHDPVTFLLDAKAEATALSNVIGGKLDKHYAKPKGPGFWLVVFSTNPYVTEYWQGGVKKISQGLVNARAVLAGRSDNPFDEIWFSDLITNPVRIFPIKD